MTPRRFFAGLVCWGLGAIFILASLPKLMAPAAFALAVSRYHILPSPLVNLAALVLPWVELLSGIAVLPLGRTPFLRRLRLSALLLIGAMLAVFTCAILYLLAQGQAASCGCFSTRADASSSNAFNVVRNLLLLAATVFAACSPAPASHSPRSRMRTPLRQRFKVPTP